MKIGLFIALVAVIHHASSFGLGCGCGHQGLGLFGIGHRDRQCGCGIPYPNRPPCRGENLARHLPDDWCSKGGSEHDKDCVPLVVRPHDLPKPNVNPIMAVELNRPVPGPCAIKKAIVKPAVLPKPVCQHQHQQHAMHGVSHCSSCDVHSHMSHGLLGLGHQGCGCYGGIHGGLHGGILHGADKSGVFGPEGVLGPNGPFGANGPNGPYGPQGPGGSILGPAALHPADAVSLDLAFKMAQQNDIRKMQSEDRLNFGFRKLPVELPAKKIVAKNIPEEQIFSLNGQIVELKPVRASSVNNEASLAEEAAEQLAQLEEEEAELLADRGTGGFVCGPRRPTLGEIGFGAAKAPTPNLIDVPASSINIGVGGVVDSCECHQGGRNIATNCGCGQYVDFHHGQYGHGGCGGYSHGYGAGCSCGCQQDKCSCKIIPGNVEFKTQPKLPQICLPPPVIPDSCESQEIEISQEAHGSGVHCSCIPVCYKTCNKSCKKSCVTIEKHSC